MTKEDRELDLKKNIDPKDLMAVERATTALLGTAISLIILGFVVEKFELFLHLITVELKNKSSQIPQIAHVSYYNYVGIATIGAGVLLSLFTYRYYVRWIEHLEKGEIDTDKNIYLWLSLFIAFIGAVLVFAMIFK